MKKSNAQPDKALAAVCNLVADLPLREVWDMVTSHIDYKHVDAVRTALNPEARDFEQTEPWIDLSEAIEAKLDEKGKKLFLKFDDDWAERDYWRSVANFYLGWVLGMKYGRVPEESPRQKLDRIANELGDTIKNMTPAEKRAYARKAQARRKHGSK